MKLRALQVIAALVVTFIATPSFGATVSSTSLNPIPPSDRQTNLSDRWWPWAEVAGNPAWVYGAEFKAEVGYPMAQPLIGKSNETGFCLALDDQCFSESSSVLARGTAGLCTGQEKYTPCVSALDFLSPSSSSQAVFERIWDLSLSQRRIDHFLRNPGPAILEVLDYSKNKGWAENPKYQLPGSSTGPLVFRLDLASGERLPFLVQVSYFADIRVEANKVQSMKFIDFDISITPVVFRNDDCAYPAIEHRSKYLDGQVRGGGSHVGCSDGNYYRDGEIAYAGRFPENLQPRLNLKLPKQIGGWFRSRLEGPDLSLSAHSPTMNNLVVSGGPANIPVTNIYFDARSPVLRGILEPRQVKEIEDTLRANPAFGGSSAGGGYRTNDFKRWAKYVDQRAKGEVQAWRVSLLPDWRIGAHPCLRNSNRLEGLVNTNAMVYQENIPEFVNGFLQYEVAGVHLGMDGKLNLGQYDLQIRADTARCFYGFSKAPISATIAVLGDQGQEVVATTTVREVDGWLKLSASGFTFSEKEIRVKLTQPISVAIDKFKSNSSLLNGKQKMDIRNALLKANDLSTIMCTGTYQSDRTRAMALRRAKSVCAYARTLASKKSYFVMVEKTSTNSLDGRVSLSGK